MKCGWLVINPVNLRMASAGRLFTVPKSRRNIHSWEDSFDDAATYQVNDGPFGL